MLLWLWVFEWNLQAFKGNTQQHFPNGAACLFVCFFFFFSNLHNKINLCVFKHFATDRPIAFSFHDTVLMMDLLSLTAKTNMLQISYEFALCQSRNQISRKITNFTLWSVEKKKWCVCSILYNELNTTRSVISRCLWSIRIQTHGWRHRKTVFFVLSNIAHCFKNVCEIIPDWKKFSRSCLRVWKRRNRDESVPGELKNTTGTNLWTVDRLWGKFVIFLILLFCSLYKTNRFLFAVCLFSYLSQKTSKCGKNISDALACGSFASFLFLPQTDTQQNEIYLLNRSQMTWKCGKSKNMAHELQASVSLIGCLHSLYPK